MGDTQSGLAGAAAARWWVGKFGELTERAAQDLETAQRLGAEIDPATVKALQDCRDALLQTNVTVEEMLQPYSSNRPFGSGL